MAKKRLKPKVEGREPNDLCPCGDTNKKINVLKLHTLYENGKTLEQLSELVGVSGRTIERWFVKHELPIRNKSECKIDPAFKGTEYTNKDGYIEIRKNQKQVLVHRMVMEDHLSRPLLSSEVIHHINGIKSDNRLENLKLVNLSTHRIEHKLPTDQWSYHYESCIKCRTTDRKHAGHGLCTKCHQMAFIIQKRGYECEYQEDGTRIFSETHIENLRAAALLRETRKKYKKCCGKGVKGTGKFPRESARRNLKPTNEEVQKSSLSILQFAIMQRMMAEKRAKRIE